MSFELKPSKSRRGRAGGSRDIFNHLRSRPRKHVPKFEAVNGDGEVISRHNDERLLRDYFKSWPDVSIRPMSEDMEKKNAVPG